MKKPNTKYQYLSFIFTILVGFIYVQATDISGPVRVANAALVSEASAQALPGQGVGMAVSSPDGNILAIAGTDGQIFLWNIATAGQTPITLSNQTASPLSGMAVAPDGKTIASVSANSLHLWDAESGNARLTLPQSVPINALAFSPDGKTLATVDEQSRVTLMDPQSGSITQQLLTGQTDVKVIAFSPDSTILATGSQDAQTKLWTVAGGQEEASLTGKAAVTELAFSPDGKTLAAAGESELVLLWDVSNKQPQLLTGHKDSVVKVIFSSDRKTLTSLDKTGQVIVWNIVTGEKQLAFQGLPSNSAVAGLPGTAGNSIANTSATAPGAADLAATNPSTVQGSVTNQNAKNANKNISKRNNWKGVTALAVSRDRTLVGAGTQNGQIKLWTSAGDERFTVPGHHGVAVTGMVFSADGNKLVSGGRDAEIQTRDAATGEQGQTLFAHEHPIRAVAASADGKHFASAGEETRVMLWDAQARKLKNILNRHSDFVNALCFSADGTHLASAGADGRILWWDVETGQLVHTLLGHSDEVNAVACSPDGKFVASGGSDTLVILWDVATGEPIQRFEGHQASVRAVAFSPNGQELVSTGEDTKILVWNTTTRQLAKQIAASTKAINALAYDPLGNLIAGDEGGEVAEWDTKKGQKNRTINVNVPPQVHNSDSSSPVSLVGSPDSIPASRSQITQPALTPLAAIMRSDIFNRILDWLIPSAEAALPDPKGPGGPILVVTSVCLPCGTFDKYYAEILRAEGLNEFAVADVDAVTASMLNNYDVVILGQMPLTSGQVTMFTNWVAAGGNLIAMKPDKQLASLLGLQDAGSTLSNGYLLVDTATSPGNGIGVSGQPMQFHGTADRYTLNGASNIATLYSSFSTATSSPAITLRSGIGTGSGRAAAFTYDLATSIVYTRQGNPVWAAQERDDLSPIRSDDKFFGNSEPDWVDLLNEVAVPQADEQQRLLANLILHMNLAKKPLPRFWYFPRGEKAVVIMTGDDHTGFFGGSVGGTAGRFEQFKSMSPANCSVADWGCVRGTSYLFPATSSMTNDQAADYTSQGFEVGLHVNTNCLDYDASGLESLYSQQIAVFTSKFPSLGANSLSTERHHCVVWSDWINGAKVQASHGIRLDTTYYFWPPNWVNNRPGSFSGSAMPMRYADLNGDLIDVYNVVTQMTDESGQTYPFTIDTLLDRALGAEGYYGAYTINAHTDMPEIPEATATVTAALARSVPVVSAKQMLNWLDARNDSSFGSQTWNGSQLSFTIARNSEANGLQVMLPVNSATGGNLTGITGPGGTVQSTNSTIKGVQYAFFTAATGTYTATYGADTTPPTVSSTSPANNASGVATSATVAATFSEAMQASTITTSTFELRTAGNTLVPAAVSYAGNTATLTPSSALAENTTYTATVKGGATGVKDLAGNALAADVTWSFTTGSGGTLGCSGGTSIWSASTTPSAAAVTDGTAIELGVKFRPNAAGFICGIRFYKGSPNTGTHEGTLWSSTGQALATATFANETASGWQQVNFANPVAVTANTVYVASYHSTGYFALNAGYFTNAGITNGPLYALRDGESGGNGVYRYGASGFPTSTFGGNNYWVDVIFTTTPSGSDTTPPTVATQSPASGASGIATSATVTATFSEAMQASTITSSTFELRTAGNTLVPAAVSYAGNTATLTPSSALAENTTYTATVKGGATGVKDLAGNALAADVTWSFTTGSGGTLGCSGGTSIWSASTTPAVASDTDGTAIEVGVKFRPNTNGYICGIRFYKGTLNSGAHVGTLWSSTGQALATASFANETASGWQQVNFANPVAVTANTVYVASYHSTGYFALNAGYFTNAGITNGPLYALRDGESGGNGVYRYGASGFPTSTFGGNNYWVDVVFTTTPSGPDTTPPTVTTQSPASGASGIATSATVAATFSEAMQASTITSSTFELRTAGNTLVPAAVSYAGNTATLTPSSALAENTTYTATVKGGATGVKDLAGNALAADVTWSFTTGSGGTLGCSGGTSIWSASTTPAVASDTDGTAIEVGVKFRPNTNGYICGIRFYKGTLNSGAHVGTLWSSTGQALATASFANETASGWQQVNFANPVAVTANTVYVASYHSTGYFALNEGFFTNAGITNGPLYALRDGESGGNGVYRYGASGFPTSTFGGNNYWVDVVFTTTPPGPDTTPPTVTSTAPAAGATGVIPTAPVTATFSEAMQASTITSSTFELRNAGNTLVPAAVSYAGNTATLTPNSALAENTTYTATVKGGAADPRVKDAAGNALATNQVWTFTTGVNPCSLGGNPIVCENAQEGNPSSEWDISGAGDATIQGFATDISVNKGGTVNFKISTPASAYRLDIYRMGYYGGNGARKVATVNATGPQNRAGANPTACLSNSTGLIDCGNWSVSTSWAVPADAVSGIYFAKAVRTDTGGASHIVFVVRDDSSNSDLLFQTSDTTWQAYNNYGGNSLYQGTGPGTGGGSNGRAYKVSYNRPFNTRAVDNGQDWVFNAEYPMVRWLEANGYNVSYFTGVDSDRRGNLISNHKVFLSVGHDEYWSGTQRTNIETARDTAGGVHLAFFSGNEVFWKTRWENSIDSSNTAHRTLVSYKETHNFPNNTDPTNTWTGTWRDPRGDELTPPKTDAGKPENALLGPIFTVNDGATTSIRVPAADGKMRFWRNTGIASLAAGTTATLPNGTLGYEWDEDLDNGFRPAGLVRLSTSIVNNAPVLTDYGSTYGSGTANHALTLYRAGSGSLVFGAGTVQWSWGLDSNHDRAGTPTDANMQQATINLFADMDVQPATLQAGLQAATASTDTTRPTSIISSPAAGASLQPGSLVTISGSAADTGGGQVGGVEVSVDGGLTWHPASGRGSWTYSWTTPNTNTTVTIKSRAVDDSINLETPSAGITVNVGSGSGSDATPPAAPSNLSATASSSTQISLTWTASTDNVAVTGYRVERCQGAGCSNFAQIATPTAASFVNSGLTPETVYQYRVRATDAAANVSGYSNVASATTQSGGTTPGGLVAAYSFDEGTGTSVSDASGNGHAGAITGATWAAGRFGNALSFNGSTNMVSVADATDLDLGTAMTLSAWVNPAVLNDWRTVILKERPNGLSYALYAHDTARPAVYINTGGGDVSANGSQSLPVNTWSHIAATYDGAILRLYINGNQVGSQSVTGTMVASASPLRIGGNTVWNEFFSGLIDEVRIYNRVLSAAEIQADSTTPVGSPVAGTTQPKVPRNLNATASSTTQVSLTWTPLTDNVAVAGYQSERCQGADCSNFTQIATPTAASFANSGLTAETVYQYRTPIIDVASNTHRDFSLDWARYSIPSNSSNLGDEGIS